MEEKIPKLADTLVQEFGLEIEIMPFTGFGLLNYFNAKAANNEAEVDPETLKELSGFVFEVSMEAEQQLEHIPDTILESISIKREYFKDIPALTQWLHETAVPKCWRALNPKRKGGLEGLHEDQEDGHLYYQVDTWPTDHLLYLAISQSEVDKDWHIGVIRRPAKTFIDEQ